VGVALRVERDKAVIDISFPTIRFSFE